MIYAISVYAVISLLFFSLYFLNVRNGEIVEGKWGLLKYASILSIYAFHACPWACLLVYLGWLLQSSFGIFASGPFIFLFMLPIFKKQSLVGHLIDFSLWRSIEFAENKITKRFEVNMGSYLGRHVFIGRDKESRFLMNDVVRQIKSQMKEQGLSFFERWKMIHWQWYFPLVGGWSVDPRVRDSVYEGCNDVNGIPLSRSAVFGSVGIQVVELTT